MNLANQLILFILLLWQTSAAAANPVCLDLFTRAPVNAIYLVDGKWVETGLPEVTMNDFTRTSVAGWYYSLASEGKLIRQQDKTLEDRNLLIENGGLCGPTCMVNMSIAGLARKGMMFEKAPDQAIHDIVTTYEKFFAADAREGVYLDALTTAGRRIYGRLFLPRPILKLPGDMEYYLESGSGLIMVAIHFKTSHTAHAMAILKVDKKTQTLIVSDPNAPELIYRVPYIMDKDNNMAFKPLHFTELGWIDEAHLLEWNSNI